MNEQHLIVTGAAGYIGSLLTGELLRLGCRVTAVDSLLYGGEALIPYLAHPNFHFAKADLTESRSLRDALPRGWQKPAAAFHLAGIVGFPACQAVGRQAAWRYNVEAAKNVFEQAASLGAEKFVYASTYSVYGASEGESPLSEASSLNPETLYAETKAAVEAFLNSAGAVIFRLPSVFGLSPRTRFDLTVNQFVLDAFLRRELLIYQRGYSRSFVHVRDVVSGLLLGLSAPNSIYNLGSESGNYTKDQLVAFVIKRLPETMVQYKNLTFGGDRRDMPPISFEKIRRELGFKVTLSVDDGVRELVNALRLGLIRNPLDEHYRNARFIVQ
ncbi:MAG: NAD(P)-dependent oxidoreductase [Anaerolineales bacterium]